MKRNNLMVLVGLVAVCSTGCITRNNEQRWDSATGRQTYNNRGWSTGGWIGDRPSEMYGQPVIRSGPIYYDNSGYNNYIPGGYLDVGGGSRYGYDNSY